MHDRGIYLPPAEQTWRDPEHWPLVSVSVLAYNSERTIARTLDSILAQVTDFDYEIIVGDDCSSDGTRAILREYQRRHPDRIQLILHPRRSDAYVAGRINNMTNLSCCRGKYTAMLDGDDFWTDPHKLRTQVAQLEAHPACTLAMHDTLMQYEDCRGPVPAEPRRLSQMANEAYPAGVLPNSLLHVNRWLPVHNSSFLFRTRCFPYFPEDFYEVIAADHYLFLLITQRGPAYYDPTLRSVYSKHHRGFSMHRDYRNSTSWRQRLRDLQTYQRRFVTVHRAGAYAKMEFPFRVQLFRALLVEKRLLSGLAVLAQLLFRHPRLSAKRLGRLARATFFP